MKHHKTLQALFSFPGFRAKQNLQGKFGSPKTRIVELVRRKKQRYVLTVIPYPNHAMISQPS